MLQIECSKEVLAPALNRIQAAFPALSGSDWVHTRHVVNQFLLEDLFSASIGGHAVTVQANLDTSLQWRLKITIDGKTLDAENGPLAANVKRVLASIYEDILNKKFAAEDTRVEAKIAALLANPTAALEHAKISGLKYSYLGEDRFTHGKVSGHHVFIESADSSINIRLHVTGPFAKLRKVCQSSCYPFQEQPAWGVISVKEGDYFTAKKLTIDQVKFLFQATRDTVLDRGQRAVVWLRRFIMEHPPGVSQFWSATLELHTYRVINHWGYRVITPWGFPRGGRSIPTGWKQYCAFVGDSKLVFYAKSLDDLDSAADRFTHCTLRALTQREGFEPVPGSEIVKDLQIGSFFLFGWIAESVARSNKH